MQFYLFCVFVLSCFTATLGATSCQTINDCVNSAECLAAEQMNQNAGNSMCYSVKCTNGVCQSVYLDKPSGDRCTSYVCSKQGTCTWKATAQKLQCGESDECTSRSCDPKRGCIETDICTSRSTECAKYSCQVGTSGKTCVETSLLKDYQCAYETCNNGRIKINYKDVNQACTSSDKCVDASCVGSDYHCQFTESKPPHSDVCKNYTCNSRTGTWSDTQKCVTNDPCSVSSCDSWGRCSLRPVDCSSVLDIKGFECYQAKCRADGSDHVCYRELLPNALFDVCGNCVFSEEDTHEELKKDVNKCYNISCVSTPALVMTEEASEWTKHANDCMQYVCINESGTAHWSLCNSSEGNNVVCVSNKCVQKKSLEARWAVEMDIEGVELHKFDEKAILGYLSSLLGYTPSYWELGMEFNNKGLVSHVAFFLNDENDVNAIADEMKKVENDDSCQLGPLCSSKGVNTQIIEHGSDMDTAPNAFEKWSAVVLAVAMILFLFAF